MRTNYGYITMKLELSFAICMWFAMHEATVGCLIFEETKFQGLLKVYFKKRIFYEKRFEEVSKRTSQSYNFEVTYFWG